MNSSDSESVVQSRWKLRPAIEADHDKIRQLVFGVLAEYGLQPDPEGTDADLNNVAVSYQDPGGLFDVLIDDTGVIVGTVGLFPVTSDRCELRKMYLLRRARGQGHGRRMLDYAIGQAVARGFRRLELETASVLVEALALYERYGFVRFTPDHMVPRCDCAYYLDLTGRQHQGSLISLSS